MDVKLPQLAEGVESGTVVSILVAEGQEIKKDQPIMELETQKAVGSIPAPSSGIVTQNSRQSKAWRSRSANALIAIESTSAPRARSQRQRAGAGGTPKRHRRKPSAPPTQTQPATTAAAVENYHYESKSGAPPPAPPAMRKIARELGIDLTRVKGSEAGGRINLGDVRAYIQRLQQHRLSQRAAKRAARRFASGRDRSAKRSHRFRQMGADTPGKDVAAPAHGQPAHGGVVDNDSENKSIRRRRYHRICWRCAKSTPPPMRKRAPISRSRRFCCWCLAAL